MHEITSQVSQFTAPRVVAADLRTHQRRAEGLFRFLDAGPHMPVALADASGRLLDGAFVGNGLEDIADPAPEDVVPVDFQPDFGARLRIAPRCVGDFTPAMFHTPSTATCPNSRRTD